MYMYGHLDVRKQVFDEKIVSWEKHVVPNSTPPSANVATQQVSFHEENSPRRKSVMKLQEMINLMKFYFLRRGGGVSSINIFCPFSYIKNYHFFL